MTSLKNIGDFSDYFIRMKHFLFGLGQYQKDVIYFGSQAAIHKGAIFSPQFRVFLGDSDANVTSTWFCTTSEKSYKCFPFLNLRSSHCYMMS